MPSIKYGPHAKPLQDWAKDILVGILQHSEIDSITITSTIRTPANQARAMYANLEESVIIQKALYGNNKLALEVISVYENQKAMGAKELIVKEAMEEKIYEVGPPKVSRHCVIDSSIAVCDIAQSSIPKNKYAAFINNIRLHETIGIVESRNDEAVHIEMRKEN